ncbi:hypothetical protein HMPREF0290_2510 [Corynebacterium efficiens YS-314]|nr:hypothetical protein HMPREF0290_2510 [Corynebacterium efficiens YS-314]
MECALVFWNQTLALLRVHDRQHKLRDGVPVAYDLWDPPRRRRRALRSCDENMSWSITEISPGDGKWEIFVGSRTGAAHSGGHRVGRNMSGDVSCHKAGTNLQEGLWRTA